MEYLYWYTPGLLAGRFFLRQMNQPNMLYILKTRLCYTFVISEIKINVSILIHQLLNVGRSYNYL